jgi:hypothetical protein
MMHPGELGPQPRRSILILIGLLTLAGPALPQTPGRVLDPKEGTIDASLPPVERGKALIAFSTGLVQQAESGMAHARAFRIDVAYYRETLRDLVRDNEQRQDSERLPKPLLMDMVRMTALLQSAAQCQTGRYIVCPPDLITQLHRQQALVEQGLTALGAPR